MSNLYSVVGDSIRVISSKNLKDQLPVGVYTVGQDLAGFFLKQLNDFKITTKLYGDVDARATRILNTYQDRPANTGVLLSGEKGSGKTMLTKRVAQRAQAELNMPVLVINTDFEGDGFNSFIQSIDLNCVVIFDEFEKIFSSESQKSILTLLDGVYQQKKLFMLTVNDRWSLDKHLINRPGRLFYHFSYSGMDDQFITEYCQDALNNKEYIPQIVRISKVIVPFNFDILKAMVEEMNRYNESPIQVLDYINAKPSEDSGEQYEVNAVFGGVPLPQDELYPRQITGNPMVYTDQLNFYGGDAGKKKIPPFEISFGTGSLAKVDVASGVYVYQYSVAGKPLEVTLTRKAVSGFTNWQNAI